MINGSVLLTSKCQFGFAFVSVSFELFDIETPLGKQKNNVFAASL